MPGREIGGPDLHLSGLIDRVTLLAAIDQSPAAYKKVFILQDFEGYGRIEFTGILGCSIGNSKSQLYEARMRLHKLFYEQARSSHPADLTISSARSRWSVPLST